MSSATTIGESTEHGLFRWVEQVVGGTIESAERGYRGGSRSLWFVDVRRSAGDVIQAVLRVESGAGMFSGTVLTLAREAAVYRALQDTGLPVPRLFGLSEDASAMLLERVGGNSDLRSLGADERHAVYDDFMNVLAALHSLDVDGLALGELERPRTPEDHALGDLAIWAELARERVDADLVDPLIVYALAWLRTQAPATVERTVLVHGDCGPGNFLASRGRVVGLIDWEFSHFGDAMDDLAWILARGGDEIFSGDRGAARVAAYERASGLTIVPRSLAYYLVFALTRCAIATSIAISRGGSVVGLAGYHTVHHRLLEQLAKAVADASGLVVEPCSLPVTEGTPRTSLYQYALTDVVEGVLPALKNRETRLRARSAATLLRHFEAVDRLGPRLAEADRAERADLLGEAEGDDALIRKVADEAGAADDARVFTYLVHRVERAAVLWDEAWPGRSRHAPE
jgi:aminoglycoside phosphotransferase (APT) family kinase protein